MARASAFVRLAQVERCCYDGRMTTQKKQKKTEIVYVRVTPDMRKRLRTLAKALDRSEAWVVADALAYYVPVVRREASGPAEVAS